MCYFLFWRIVFCHSASQRPSTKLAFWKGFLGTFKKSRICNTYKKHFCFTKGFYAYEKRRLDLFIYCSNDWWIQIALNMTSQCSIEHFPPEILQLLFVQLNLKDLGNCSKTCVRWKLLIVDLFKNKGNYKAYIPMIFFTTTIFFKLRGHSITNVKDGVLHTYLDTYLGGQYLSRNSITLGKVRSLKFFFETGTMAVPTKLQNLMVCS